MVRLALPIKNITHESKMGLITLSVFIIVNAEPNKTAVRIDDK